ncbi:glycosyltransferase family 2 protein [Patescibacteria group bacterium]|nr:glycosyltransferase family 2 protein [Candidatus Falkowbacteria bacterium]MBU3906154.1 glycosyltransferase family 2 protein [Patescibacteria group bacterium]MCG2697516.1 glycosyltransferase family 2 protein [Candidatus Parcubacteria bacterium]MBU4014681.1 glycosyltransferase family 2 protein [Patescibacteria group bacterium]MBU4026647.1 glycosyltransferase family 2 protein [Patescibacteria group bacterium]
MDNDKNKSEKKPFFSVVIPTKNRSFLVGYAIESILLQTFKNFELIIADNDDTDDTKNVVAMFDDSRIRYYRTGNLSMPDNWEYGCTKITGKYLLVIEDKMALKLDSLQNIFNVILEKKAEVIKWQHDYFVEDTGMVHSFPEKFKAQFFDSDSIVKSFLDINFDFFTPRAPSGYDVCVCRKIVKIIQEGAMKRLFIPVSCDFMMGLQILNTVDKIFVMPDMLTTMGGLKYSSGGSYKRKNGSNEQFLKELKIQEADLYKNTPIVVRTLSNALLNDYINLAKIIGGRLNKFQLNKFNYFISIYDQLQSPSENFDIKKELNVWEETLLKQDDAFIAKIRKEIDLIKNKKQPNNYFLKFITILKLMIRKMWKKPKHASILDYIKQKL